GGVHRLRGEDAWQEGEVLDVQGGDGAAREEPSSRRHVASLGPGSVRVRGFERGRVLGYSTFWAHEGMALGPTEARRTLETHHAKRASEVRRLSVHVQATDPQRAHVLHERSFERSRRNGCWQRQRVRHLLACRKVGNQTTVRIT